MARLPRSWARPQWHRFQKRLHIARTGGPRGAGNNQTSRMVLTQRAVVFRSAEIASEEPSVLWGSRHSVLAIVCREPRPRPPLRRPISGPNGTTPAKAETAGARVGGAGSCPFDAANQRACRTHPASQARPLFLKHAPDIQEARALQGGEPTPFSALQGQLELTPPSPSNGDLGGVRSRNE